MIPQKMLLILRKVIPTGTDGKRFEPDSAKEMIMHPQKVIPARNNSDRDLIISK